MEHLDLWAHLFKSLVRSSALTVSQSVNSYLFIAAYLIAIKFANTRQLRLSFLCLTACLVISNSVIYESINGWQLHLIYSIIYLFAVPLTDKLKTMLALFLMALFNGLMIWDAYNYATTETWLYGNYEYITACVHVVIICTGVNWRNLITKLDDSVSHIRYFITNTSCFLHSGVLLRYNKETENCEKRSQ
jgi:hypothetical protein